MNWLPDHLTKTFESFSSMPKEDLALLGTALLELATSGCGCSDRLPDVPRALLSVARILVASGYSKKQSKPGWSCGPTPARLMSYLLSCPGGSVARSVLLRTFRMSSASLDIILDDLIRDGKVTVSRKETSGRPSSMVRVVS